MKQHEKIKDQKIKILEFFFVILILIFLFLNLVYSQSISPLYSKIINNDKVAIISFLQKIKSLPEYQSILEMNNNIYGETLKEEILMTENKKKALINNLEQQLIINTKARDILYSLYQLNFAEGNKNRASYYLKLAKDIDPSIK